MGYDRIVYIRYHFSCGLDRKDACWLSFTPLTGFHTSQTQPHTLHVFLGQKDHTWWHVAAPNSSKSKSCSYPETKRRMTYSCCQAHAPANSALWVSLPAATGIGKTSILESSSKFRVSYISHFIELLHHLFFQQHAMWYQWLRRHSEIGAHVQVNFWSGNDIL